VWIERWTLPDGAVELRRTSAETTDIARVDDEGCRVSRRTLRRSFDSSATAGALTDAALRRQVESAPRGIVYVWSPGMPLSVQGLEAARRAARTLGVAFTATMVEAGPGYPRPAATSPTDARAMESVELMYRNATVHYPAVQLYRDGQMLDGVIPGYKSETTYAALLRTRFGDPADDRVRTVTPPTLRMWVDHKARVTVVSSIAMPRDVGFFFKPVAGTTLVTYTANDIAYLFDRANGTERRIPGHVDPVPTPDGLFLTRPGLIIHPMDALRVGDTASIYRDTSLPDEYQTASIIAGGRNALRYRMVTGWRENARFRDYDVSLSGTKSRTRAAVFKPVAPAFVPCAARVLSLPISAKSGREFGAFDVRRGTNGVLEVTRDGGCVDRLDLGFASGKLSFSYDGRLLAFSTSRINVDTAGALRKPSEMFYEDALVLERASGRLVALTRNRPIRVKSFPEFMPDGSVMVLDQQTFGRPAKLMTLRVR